MTIEEKNTTIMKYTNNKLISLEKQGIIFSEEQKKTIFTKHLNSDKSIEQIMFEIDRLFEEIEKYYQTDSQYNDNLYIPEDKNDPLKGETNARTLRKTLPKFGTIDSGYSHTFIISLIVLLIILLIVIYLAYLTVNK